MGSSARPSMASESTTCGRSAPACSGNNEFADRYLVVSLVAASLCATCWASGEAVFRARRNDPGFDFAGPAVEYAKAVETELNALIFPALRRRLKGKKPAERETRVDGVPLDLGGAVTHQTLGVIRTLLLKDDVVRRTLPLALQHDAKWLLGELPPALELLVNLRNPGAHSEVLGRDAVTKARDGVLGVGCEGLIVRIARARMRAVR